MVRHGALSEEQLRAVAPEAFEELQAHESTDAEPAPETGELPAP